MVLWFFGRLKMRYGNKVAIRKMIFERNKVVRPGWTFTRVSENLYDELDIAIQGWVDNQLRSAPSVGKTFKPQVV